MNTTISPKLDKLLLDMGIDMPVSPTVADVLMHLYEKYGVWIDVDIEGEGFDIFHFLVYRNHEERVKEYIKKLNDENYHTNYKTPAEAYEAAIEYTLNNLI